MLEIGLRTSDLEKRYQVFISSTFQDLQGARQEVSQALLRADCFPAGMELFPAADEEQFEFIKTVIDQSDYYILISAGRYGSIHPETGLSYTEMEYDYAVETGKPVIRLLHKDPFNELKGEFIEKTDEGKKALERFRSKLSSGSLINFWNNSNELGLLVVNNLMDSFKRRPAIGWVRSDAVQPQDKAKIFELQSRILELEALVKKYSEDFDPLVQAREIGYQNLRSQIVPNRMRLSHKNISSTNMVGSIFSKSGCDLCNGDQFITIQNANSKREQPCPKCKDEGRI